MRVVRAQHLGMCFGVRDAIEMAVKAAARQPLTILGELVHNEVVLQDLRTRGIRLCGDMNDVDTPTVMITAHGASEQCMAAARARRLELLDATCPLVRAAQRAVAELVRDGYHPIVIGKRDHVEVRGMTDGLSDFAVVLTEEDVGSLAARRRLGIVAQTTQPATRVNHLALLIRRRFPESDVRLVDTVCRPTKLRQRAAEDLARRCDVIVVIGGARSNNTRELVVTCQRHCTRVFHVQTAGDVRAEWFGGAALAGITAGTSTPESVIAAVEARVRDITKGQVAA
jgi:4-hydroxy-3-methylbut-2-en-1-yl diphosphate reductase